MNRKLLVASLAMLVSASALAGTVKTYGVMPCDSGLEETVISVPFLSVKDSEITISNLVMTTNLSEGDKLFYYNTSEGQFESWVVATEGGVKVWTSVMDVPVGGGEAVKSADPSGREIKYGKALILRRSDWSKPFYLTGYVSATTSSVTEIPAEGTPTVPVFTLIAPPQHAATDINDTTVCSFWYSGGASKHLKDEIILTDGTRYVYNDGTIDGDKDCWGKVKRDGRGYKFVKADKPVPMGTGFWYRNTAGMVMVGFPLTTEPKE